MKGKILVTGGTGFIGSHTVVQLISAGYEVVIIDDLSNSKAEVVDSIATITGVRPGFYPFDLCDMEQLANCVKAEAGIEAVMHFAASKAVGESVEQPLRYYRNNLVSLINLLEMMVAERIRHIVFSSSCTVYGQPDSLPVTEDTPYGVSKSPYSATKRMSEDILRDTCKANTVLNAIALRYFNPVGAHDSGLIGEFPNGVPSNLIPFITQTAAGIRDQLQIFGNDYNTPDGTAIRDFIHVVDLADAHVRALERMLGGNTKTSFEFFNIGTGKGYSVLEAVKKFEEVNEVRVTYKMAPRRAGDIEQIYADTTLGNRELGWKAQRGLDEMMKSAWKWQKRLVEREKV